MTKLYHNVFYIDLTLLEVTGEKGEVIWNKPPDWCGPEPVLYQSFDTSAGLILWEGAVQISEVPLISGKVMVQIKSAKLSYQ